MKDFLNLIVAFGRRAHSVLRLSGLVWRQDVIMLSSKGHGYEQNVCATNCFSLSLQLMPPVSSRLGMPGANFSSV